MGEQLTPDLCVIGAGSGGLTVAAGAAQLGVEVVLIEKGKMGGDCLNYGCVPSKAMIAAARRAHIMRNSEAFGIAHTEPEIDHSKLHDHIHQVIAAIEPNDSIERFTGLGVNVIQGEAQFVDKRTVIAGGKAIKARRFVIATGSSPSVPPIPGIEKAALFTNETIFENKERPGHLIIIGGGPIGMELAQAHRRLGSQVTVLEAFTALSKDDPELTAVVLKHLKDEGIEIMENVRIERIDNQGSGIRIEISKDGESGTVEGTHLLVAAGRRPNVDELNLEAAKIKYDRRGIKVTRRLKTTNGYVYAIGDVAGAHQFTHVAGYHAGIVIKNALFRLPVKANTNAIPWVTYTDPELAHAGMTEEQAQKKYGRRIRILRWPYAENDRAQAERATDGFIKVITTKKGKILGASIVGKQAGDIIQMWVLAISQGMKIKAFTSFISPYPTLTEINKRAAYQYYLPSLTNPFLRRIIALLAKFG